MKQDILDALFAHIREERWFSLAGFRNRFRSVRQEIRTFRERRKKPSKKPAWKILAGIIPMVLAVLFGVFEWYQQKESRI